MHLHNRYLFVVFAVVASLAFAMPSRADDTTQSPPASGGASQDDGSGGLAPPSYSHVPTHGLAAPQPLPPGLPTTSKSGDDLIVHSSSGDTTFPGFLKNIPPGQAETVTVVVPDHGGCKLTVDSTGATVEAKCDQ